MKDDSFLTLKDAALLLGINERTMKRILTKNDKQISSSKIGGRYLIGKDKLLELINNGFLDY